MSEKIYPVDAKFAEHCYIDDVTYHRLYRQSLDQPEVFWREQAQQFINWFEPFETVLKEDKKKHRDEWFSGGKLNVCYNCLDRHLDHAGEQPAIIWECDEEGVNKVLTYNELFILVCKFANVLKSRGVSKGDRVVIYMPMIVETAIAMLACARIGAVHSVVFGGFSPEALRDRILDSQCHVVITADEGIRGGKRVRLKANVEQALAAPNDVHTTIVIQRTGASVPMNTHRDIWYHDAMVYASSVCMAEKMDAEDPFFILYTSGSTGKPKGILHTTAGYLLYTAMTHKYVFNYQPKEVYWCSADLGWITGHSYVLYGPLANGATTLMFEGVPTYPNPSRYWEIIDKYQVSIFYTSPTAIRALMALGDQFVKSTKRKSLKILGTVGEPINPEPWEWYYRVVGRKKCPIIDSWWQTETGGIAITPLPGVTALKPGSATKPFFGIEPVLLDEQGQAIEGPGQGALAIKRSWPGRARSIYNDHKRFIDNYFNVYPGYYTTGDGARRDEQGDYWITGRIDDVINVSGHRMGTAEIENAIVEHDLVAEAAVVGYKHPIKGQGIYAFVTLMVDATPSNALKSEIFEQVVRDIGQFARPDMVQWTPGLPKTRSGKIMRRILRKIAAGDVDDLGDISTLAEPKVVDDLVAMRQQIDQ